jgi:hypothetical protein
MTAGRDGEDGRRPGDAIDQAIDQALRAEIEAGGIDLRQRVLGAIDEPAAPSRPWLRFVLRPAMLPAAGALLIVAAVALTWQHVDRTLARIGTRQQATAVVAARPGAADARSSLVPRPSSRVPRPSSPVPAAAIARVTFPPLPAAAGRVTGAAIVSPESALAEEEADQPVPGAMGGDLGDPIRPIPLPRPLVLRPLVHAPIVAEPIAAAPPVSTLVQPADAVPTVGEVSRDPAGPAKLGGERQ